MFVETADREWVNLSRASALKVEPHANPKKSGYVVLAFYSGRVHTLGTFPTEQQARDWLGDLLEDCDLGVFGDDD